MVFNATFYNISVISFWSVLFVEETGEPGENVTDNLYHIMLYTSPWSRFELTSVGIGTDSIGNCKSNYHTTTPTMAPGQLVKVKHGNIERYAFASEVYHMLRLFNHISLIVNFKVHELD
jgi:hypothetical protein